jgi:hypothetical protein
MPPNCEAAGTDGADFVYSLRRGTKGRPSAAYIGSRRLVRAHGFDEVLRYTASHIERTVAEHARESLFIHAGVVAWRGRAILLPGPSYAGKSTLVRSLLGLGAAYYSDEFAAIDSDGFVQPFPRPLTLRSSTGRRMFYPDRHGIAIGSQSIPASAVVLTRYAPGARWNPAPVSGGLAVLELLRNTVAVRSNPARSLEAIKHLVCSTLAIESARGEAEATAPLLLNTVDNLTRNMQKGMKY